MSDEKLRSKFRPDVIDPVEEKLITHEGVEMPVDRGHPRPRAGQAR